MAFDGLTDKLTGIFNKLRGKSKITEDDVNEITREIRMALLEADVNYKVVKDFISSIKEKAVGHEVLKSITPGQQIVKIVHDELVKVLGSEDSELSFSNVAPTVFMLVGLQGSGKTTMAGKLANYLRKKGKKPLMVACDIYRPAAIKQLQVVGKQLSIPVYAEEVQTSAEKNIDSTDDTLKLGEESTEKVLKIAQNALAEAKKNSNDVVIIDTAGRLQIDEILMKELSLLKDKLSPKEILLVVDAMTGQAAVDVSEKFNEDLDITGVILTKFDGDTRGGAALSVKSVTGKSIKFIGVGEKMSDLEVFHPDRMATRILGMGDVLSLVEKAEENIEIEEAIKLEKKLRKQEFTLQDYLEQLEKVKKLGSFKTILDMFGVRGVSSEQLQLMEKNIITTKAIICSMTKAEKKDPSILNASRRIRIAKGSGTTVQDVNLLVKQYDMMKKQMKDIMGNKEFLRRAAKSIGKDINPEDLKKYKVR